MRAPGARVAAATAAAAVNDLLTIAAGGTALLPLTRFLRVGANEKPRNGASPFVMKSTVLRNGDRR
jgi:hypothetical protein